MDGGCWGVSVEGFCGIWWGKEEERRLWVVVQDRERAPPSRGRVVRGVEDWDDAAAEEEGTEEEST